MFTKNVDKLDTIAKAYMKIQEEAAETKSPAVDGDLKSIPVRKEKADPKSASKKMDAETPTAKSLSAEEINQIEAKLAELDEAKTKEDMKNDPKYKDVPKKKFDKMKFWDKTKKD